MMEDEPKKNEEVEEYKEGSKTDTMHRIRVVLKEKKKANQNDHSNKEDEEYERKYYWLNSYD